MEFCQVKEANDLFKLIKSENYQKELKANQKKI